MSLLREARLNKTDSSDVLTGLIERKKSEPKLCSRNNDCIGRIVSINNQGQALVDFLGNGSDPILARSAIHQSIRLKESDLEGASVLLTFENGDPTAPIIIGVVRDNLISSNHTETVVKLPKDKRCVEIDGERMIFDAKEEIVLRCGKGSITLKKNGKIVLKGTEIVSRASDRNKIRGGSVQIN